MNVKEFRQYYLNTNNMDRFMEKYKDKLLHLCDNYKEIVDECIESGWCKYDEDEECYFLESDLYCDYHFDFSENAFVPVGGYETNTLAVFYNDEEDVSVPLYCIKEAWNFMEEENKVEEMNSSIEETIISDKALPLKMLSNLDILKDVVNLKKKANLNDDDTLKMLELLFK